jgi:hypothetical protein
MRAPERREDGALYVRFLDLDAEGLDAEGYPGHPVGRYVSLEDLERFALEYEDDTLLRMIATVREHLSLSESS